jgi:hypothetical protein
MKFGVESRLFSSELIEHNSEVSGEGANRRTKLKFARTVLLHIWEVKKS